MSAKAACGRAPPLGPVPSAALTLENTLYMAALAPAMGALATSSRSTARQYASVDGAADALKESTTRTVIATTAAYVPPPPLSAKQRSALRCGVATVRLQSAVTTCHSGTLSAAILCVLLSDYWPPFCV